MTRTKRTPANVGPFPRWYLWFYSACAVLAVIALVIGVLGVFTNARQDAEQAAANKARDEQTQAFQACLDDYATRSSGRTALLSKKSEVVGMASLARSKASLRWVNLLVRGLALDPEEGSEAALALGIRFARLTTGLQKAERALFVAQEDLERARANNPVPAPPSTFCEVSSDSSDSTPQNTTPDPKPTRTPNERRNR